jgi:hypothetical protein
MRFLLLALLLACRLVGQVVEESFFRDPGPLDFIKGEGLEQAILQSLTGDALVGLNLRGQVVARLCTRWEVRGETLRLKLRNDAGFPDGRAVAFEDVLWTIQELQRDHTASPTRRAIVADLRVTEAKGWIELRSAKSPHRLLLELARIPIARKGRPDQGSGPFQLRRAGGDWHLTARAHFLNPAIPELHFRLVGEDQAMLQNLQKGWLTLGVPPARAGLVPPASHVRLVQPTHGQVVVWSRLGAAPLQALERWRASAFPADFFGDKARASRGLWPESLGFRARAIAAPNSVLPAGMALELLYPAGDELVQKALLALSARALKEGVQLEPRPVEPGLLYERLQRGTFQLACAVVLFDPHPWAVLEYLEPAGPMNFTEWSHPRLAAILPRLDTPNAPAWMELAGLWASAPAALPLLDLHSVVWIDRRLQVEPSPMGLYLTTPGAAGWKWRR